uniref:WAP domain-containing protein n=1 Tax=Sinocyclocheilus grahami TaxID=75366 RepID=A0A672M2X2_SINGR
MDLFIWLQATQFKLEILKEIDKVGMCMCIYLFTSFLLFCMSAKPGVFQSFVCITEKPGVCPRRFIGVGLCKTLCVSDIDCPKDEKCCSTKCGRECTPPFIEKPGVCPSRSLRIGVCAEMCSHDRDCPNNQKCCSNGCGHQCMAPYRVFSGACADRCSHDGDCPKDEKCCRTKCGLDCTPPFAGIEA